MTDLKVSQTLASILIGALTVALSSPVKAASFSFRGSLSVDNPIQFFSFTTSTDSTVTLKTFSSTGGTQADGTIDTGGSFDPIVSLFDGNSSPNILINDNDDSDSLDSLLEQSLTPGKYTVALSQFPNFAPFEESSFDSTTDNWSLDILNVDAANTTAPQAIAVPVPLAGL